MYERGHAPFKATARAATLLKSAVTAMPPLPTFMATTEASNAFRGILLGVGDDPNPAECAGGGRACCCCGAAVGRSLLRNVLADWARQQSQHMKGAV